MDYTEQETDGVAVIRPVGDLDVTTALELRLILGKHVEREAARVVLDLEAVPFVDSSGIGVLVSASRRIGSRGGELVLAAAGPGVLKVLELTRTIRVFTVVGSVQDAVARFGAGK